MPPEDRTVQNHFKSNIYHFSGVSPWALSPVHKSLELSLPDQIWGGEIDEVIVFL